MIEEGWSRLRGRRGRWILGVAPVIGTLACLLAPSPALAAGRGAWAAAARRVPFPVYRPRRTAGLRFDGVHLLKPTRCLVASWGDPQSSKGPHLNLAEPGASPRCGQPGVATEVAKVRVNGIEVPVLAQCAQWPKCTIKDGESSGDLLLFVPERTHRHRHYEIQLESRHMSLRRFLKVARSFTRVKPRRARPHRHRLHFWGSLAEVIKAPGQPVAHEYVRPSTILVFQDGSWALVKLRWSGWGSQRAHGTGTSSRSNGIPNQAQGKRIKSRARITLSKPGRFFGRRVYRCFRLRVRRPATDVHGCLTDHHGYWSLS